MSIATKTGDQGDTALMYGRRVPKNDMRVEAYGCVDELTSALGLVRATVSETTIRDQVHAVQRDLVAIMGELATAPEDLERYRKDGFTPTSSAMVDGLTAAIDELERDPFLYPKDWVLPGSTLASAALDLARTACRRAERWVAHLQAQHGSFNGEILRYLNRLSDLCWLLARKVEKKSPSGTEAQEK